MRDGPHLLLRVEAAQETAGGGGQLQPATDMEAAAGSMDPVKITEKVVLKPSMPVGETTPTQSQLFWRGVGEDSVRYGEAAQRYGQRISTTAKIASKLARNPVILAKLKAVELGGQISRVTGKGLAATGRWIIKQFPNVSPP